MPTYLDFNASAPIDMRVLEYMDSIYRNYYGNADSRTHSFGTAAKDLVLFSRKNIGDILGVDNTDVIFTSGATESNNLAIVGMLEYALQSGRKHFITTSIEHKSVLESMKYLQKHGCEVDYVNPEESGRVSADKILSLVRDDTLLVSMMHVNSETGIIQPIEEVGSALEKTSTYFHIDATQGFGKLNDTLRKTQYDMMSITAHKIGGPQGIGALILRRDATYRRPPIRPIMFGGPQERGYRPGTTPVALVAGFSLAAQLSDAEAQDSLRKCADIKKELLHSISGLEYAINGDQNYCLPSTINISFKGVDAETLFLSLKDIYAFSNGSACNSGSHESSYVLKAMNLPEDRIDEAIRISWDKNTKVDFTQLTEFIKTMV